MAKFTCPYCYGEHTLVDCSMKCSYNIAGDTTAQCKRKVPRGVDGWIPKQYKTGCLSCKEASKLFFCPDSNREIPREFLDGPALPIALIGAKASGKSNYIGVLINEIRKRMSARFNCSLSIACNEESKRYYSEFYYRPIYEMSTAVVATDAGEIPPLIFPVRFMDNKNRIKNTAILTFYDTAGENFDDQEEMRLYNRYLPNSKGIILLLDPLQVDSIRKKLDGKMDLPNKNTDINEVLSRVVENIRQVKNIKGTIKIPLAVAFTKIDALEKFNILSPDSCLRDESEHIKRGVFVVSDAEACDNEMRGILENYLDSELIQLMKNFEKCSFFGVSSFGDIPTGIKLNPDTLKPRRVLDPLLWLLAENNYIKKVK